MTDIEKAKRAPLDKATTKLPRFVENDDSTWTLEAQGLTQLREMFGGSQSDEFANAMLIACGSISGTSNDHREDKNHALAIVAELAPKDSIEAMLATQMASVHLALMRHSRFMAAAKTIPQLDVQERVFNKLARTFAAQVETLRKHRSGGEQKMTVEHVHVHEGGQAIVGNVNKGG